MKPRNPANPDMEAQAPPYPPVHCKKIDSCKPHRSVSRQAESAVKRASSLRAQHKSGADPHYEHPVLSAFERPNSRG